MRPPERTRIPRVDGRQSDDEPPSATISSCWLDGEWVRRTRRDRHWARAQRAANARSISSTFRTGVGTGTTLRDAAANSIGSG